MVDLANVRHEHSGSEGLSNRLNWLRAGVLGANDGIVSVAGIVMGVAAASDERSPILIAGIAALVAGALSMAAGEYVSVSTQRDAELALVEAERRDLKRMPEEELQDLTQMLQDRGMTPETAEAAAQELTEWNALRVHSYLEFGIDLDDVTNPWSAAFASMVAFTTGALLPMLTILLPSPERFYVTVGAVLIALALTGFTSAKLGFANTRRAMIRNVLGGAFAMGVTYLIGSLLGTQV
ncbi:VIT1/CCC1 transporter family protein [Nocardioides sp. Iso805N]|uniref:VIT1/CCC1 transporter family protein n=1 Tax=Nocardioides sp. Iso805N TaxID=1283287 RepID=UPI00037E4B8C|nr:VIT family protein [Nocardioides sp. Iso805N]